MTPLDHEQKQAIKQMMLTYNNFLTNCGRMHRIRFERESDALKKVVIENIAAFGKELAEQQRDTGVVMFTDMRSLLAALTNRPVDENFTVMFEDANVSS